MPRKKAAPKEEQPKIVTPTPEAETPEAALAPPAAPEAPPAPSDPPQAPEAALAPSDPSQTGSDLVDPRDGQTPVEQETPPGPDGLPAIVTASKGLNLRAGPGFGFDVLRVVEAGTLLLVLDLPMGVKVPGWALIWSGETAGWVSDKHLRLLTE